VNVRINSCVTTLCSLIVMAIGLSLLVAAISNQAVVITPLMSIGVLFIIGLCGFLVLRMDRNRRESERQLKRSNDELEDRVLERTATLEQIVDLLTAENRERQAIEADLAKERNLLRTLIDTLPDYIFIKNSDRESVLSNLAHARAAGLDPHTLIGKHARDNFPPELAAQFEDDDLKVLRDGESLINVERASVDGEGNLTTMLTTKVPLKTEDGKVVGLIGVSRDIRDRQEAIKKQMQLEIERGRVVWLEQLIRNLSHDQRTPMTIMRSSLYLLQKTEDAAKRAEYVQRIEAQLMHLEQSGENMESLARLELGSGSLRLTACNVSAIVPDVVTASAAAMDEKQHTLTLQLADELPPVLADRVELMRAIKHLLTNAIHYTHAGGSITITTRQEGERVALDVSDNGIGISQQDLPHVFNAFYRADKARGLDTGGSGLGLTIVKRVIELLGGEVRIESELGKGTQVTLLLPTIPEATREKLAQRMFA
jgi:two-component system, sensor histidine kinase and response regulator